MKIQNSWMHGGGLSFNTMERLVAISAMLVLTACASTQPQAGATDRRSAKQDIRRTDSAQNQFTPRVQGGSSSLPNPEEIARRSIQRTEDFQRRLKAADDEDSLVRGERFLSRYEWLHKWQMKVGAQVIDFVNLAIAVGGDYGLLCGQYAAEAKIQTERAEHLKDLLQLAQFKGNSQDTAQNLFAQKLQGTRMQLELDIQRVSIDLARVQRPGVATMLDKYRDELRAFQNQLEEIDRLP